MNHNFIYKLASNILAKMQIYDVTAVQLNEILKFLRSQFGIESMQDPIWRAYMTKQEGVSNKFHYFTVFEKDGVYYAANAYGRIGYNPRLSIIDKSTDLKSTLDFAKRKFRTKTMKGYKVIEEEEDKPQLARAAKKKIKL